MNLTTTIDLNEIIGIALLKLIQYKKISMNENEIKDFTDLLTHDEDFINAAKNIVKITNK